MNRPSDKRSSVAARFASTAGLCNGATTTAVPKRRFVVNAAKNASSSSGSGIGTTPAALGMRPSDEYGYFGS
jgi:hypothetical protein